MPITLTIEVSHPDVVSGDARNALYNSIAQSFEVLGPEWTHRFSHSANGSLTINFERKANAPVQMLCTGTAKSFNKRLQELA